MRTRWMMIALVMASGACSGAEPAPVIPLPANPPAPENDEPATVETPSNAIAIAPFDMQLTLKHDGPELHFAVAADGSITNTDKGEVVGKIVDNEIQKPDGAWMIRVNADGTVEARSTMREVEGDEVVKEEEKISALGSFTADDTLEGPKGKVTIKDGMITVTKPDGTTKTVDELKFTGLTPETQKTALLLFATMMAGTTVTVEQPTASPPAAEPPK